MGCTMVSQKAEESLVVAMVVSRVVATVDWPA
jgi:hypothetical protein